MAKKTKKMTVTTIPTPQAIELKNDLLAKVNPLACVTIEQRLSAIDTCNGIGTIVECAKYRLIYDIYLSGDYKKLSDAKGEKYTSFIKWVCDRYGIGRSAGYNMRKVGQLIKPDGSGTILAHPNPLDDFTLSQLVGFCEAPELSEEITDENGKTYKAFKLEPKLKKNYDEYGNRNRNVPYIEETDENGDTIYCTILENLCFTGEVTPAKCGSKATTTKALIKKILGANVIDIDEVVDEATDSATDEATDTDFDEAPDSATDSEINITLTQHEYIILMNALHTAKTSLKICEDTADDIEEIRKLIDKLDV